MLDSCGEAVLWLLFDPKWECRDSALDFLTAAVEHWNETWAVRLFAQPGLIAQAWHCRSDKESFVRTSCLRWVGSLLAAPPVWDVFVQTAGDVLVHVVEAFHDTEAFVRRAAVETLEHALRARPADAVSLLAYSGLRVAVARAVDDVDWEVRVRALALLAAVWSLEGGRGLALFEAADGDMVFRSLGLEEPTLRSRAAPLVRHLQLYDASSGVALSPRMSAFVGWLRTESEEMVRETEEKSLALAKEAALPPLLFFAQAHDLPDNSMDCY